MNRYDRQISLPEIGKAGQEKLRNAKVLIVGVGGLGSPIAFYLAGAGVGTLGLVDNDKVSISTFNVRFGTLKLTLAIPNLYAAPAEYWG